MLCKRIFILAISAALIGLLNIPTLAQTGALRGHVVFREGFREVEAADAVIDVYRTDKPGQYNTKTDRNGKFHFYNLPYVGTYTIAVSMANAQPQFKANVKAGRMTDCDFVLQSGDGHRLRLEDIQTGGSAGFAADLPTKTKIKTSYDRFRDETTISSEIIIFKGDNAVEELRPSFSMHASFAYGGQSLKVAPQQIQFGFDWYVFEGNRTHGDEFALINEFIVLADSERLAGTLKRSIVRDEVGGTHEVLITSLDLEAFAKIATAQKVEMRVGTKEFELKEYQLETLREFLAKTKP